MRLWSSVNSMLRNLLRKRQVEGQLDEEVRAFVTLVSDEKMAAGMTAEEARRTALAEFGGMEQVKQSVRDHRAGAGLEVLWQDVRFGMRQLLRNPGFTWTALITLALSIGANTAIFSIVNALMLKSLPYPHPGAHGHDLQRTQGAEASDELRWIDGEQWEQLRDNVPSLLSAVFSSLASGVNLQAGQHVQYLHAGRVSAHYLDVLGLHPALGRNFLETEDRVNGPKAAILSSVCGGPPSAEILV